MKLMIRIILLSLITLLGGLQIPGLAVAAEPYMLSVTFNSNNEIGNLTC
jgi:hypothetical protein